jgi:hypothetical protein
MKVVERQSSQFAGLVLGDELRATLRRMGAKPVAQGILKLLDEPADPAANLTVGRWYAFTARRWDDGMPMLANGSDAGLAKLAQMELDKPGEAAERAQLADAWFEAARKPVGKDDRIPMLSRALSWYGEALGGLTGLQKDGVAKRMAEIEKQLPIDVDNIDWKTLTAGQWDRIKAPIVTVQMRLDRTDAQVVLKAGERVRVVAHPSETWTVDLGTWGGVVTTNWRGRKMPAAAMSGVHRMAAMLCWIDNGAKQNCGIIAGPGKLYLGPNSDWWYNPERNGSIRAKIVPVEDDED